MREGGVAFYKIIMCDFGGLKVKKMRKDIFFEFCNWDFEVPRRV